MLLRNSIHGNTKDPAYEKKIGALDWLFDGLLGLLNDLEVIYSNPEPENLSETVAGFASQVRIRPFWFRSRCTETISLWAKRKRFEAWRASRSQKIGLKSNLTLFCSDSSFNSPSPKSIPPPMLSTNCWSVVTSWCSYFWEIWNLFATIVRKMMLSPHAPGSCVWSNTSVAVQFYWPRNMLSTIQVCWHACMLECDTPRRRTIGQSHQSRAFPHWAWAQEASLNTPVSRPYFSKRVELNHETAWARDILSRQKMVSSCWLDCKIGSKSEQESLLGGIVASSHQFHEDRYHQGARRILQQAMWTPHRSCPEVASQNVVAFCPRDSSRERMLYRNRRWGSRISNHNVSSIVVWIKWTFSGGSWCNAPMHVLRRTVGEFQARFLDSESHHGLSCTPSIHEVHLDSVSVLVALPRAEELVQISHEPTIRMVRFVVIDIQCRWRTSFDDRHDLNLVVISLRWRRNWLNPRGNRDISGKCWFWIFAIETFLIADYFNLSCREVGCSRCRFWLWILNVWGQYAFHNLCIITWKGKM